MLQRDVLKIKEVVIGSFVNTIGRSCVIAWRERRISNLIYYSFYISTSTMVSKNLPMNIKIVLPIKYICIYIYMMDISGESLHTWVIIRITILPNLINTRTNLSRNEDSCIVWDKPKWYQKHLQISHTLLMLKRKEKVESSL